MTLPNLLEKFVNEKPSNVAGARSANRFAFQQSWALCLILDLHKRGSDYLVVFDYHDDVVVFDSASNPSRIDCYQVKTHDRSWTVTKLTDKGETTGSILGKMYSNLRLGDEGACNLISNAQYNVRLFSQPKKLAKLDDVVISDLSDELRHEISSRIQEELKLDHCPIEFSRIKLLAANLHVKDHRDHSLGRFVAFLDWIAPGEKLESIAANKAIRSLIEIRNNCEEVLNSPDEIAVKKGISREEFESIIQKITSSRKKAEAWETFRLALTHEKMDPFRILIFQKAWEEYEVDRMDPTNAVLAAAQSIINEALKLLSGKTFTGLEGYCEEALKLLSTNNDLSKLPIRYSDPYLVAMILMERYELENS